MKAAPSAQMPRVFPECGLSERIGPPALLQPEQRAAADDLINGPRRGVYGPFRPLLHVPGILNAVAKVGEALRYGGAIEPALREWTICVVARELSNIFEWDMHLPLAAAAGVPADALAALAERQPSPATLGAELALARDVVCEIVSRHRLSDATYSHAVALWSEATLVELLTLVGYFTMVCWLMNVARTPGPAS